MRDKYQEIKKLLEKNADVNFKNKFKQTFFSKAAEEDFSILIKLLFDHDADVNVKNIDERTVLF